MDKYGYASDAQPQALAYHDFDQEWPDAQAMRWASEKQKRRQHERNQQQTEW